MDVRYKIKDGRTMRIISVGVAVLLLAGCQHKQEKTDLAAYDQARAKFLGAYSALVKQDDIDAVLYIFEDGKPVVRLPSKEFTEAYRLVFLPSFQNPVLITVYAKGEKVWLNLRVSKASFRGVVMNKTIPISKEQLETLRKVVDENGFWEHDIPRDKSGRDGYHMAIEVKRSGTYHKVIEWCPEKNIQNIGQYMIDLSGHVAGEAIY